MKVYPKQDEGSAAAGGSGGAIDPKKRRKYTWPMIYAILLLEQHVARERDLFCFCCHLCFTPKPHPALGYCSQISFEARTRNLPHYNDCLLSVDRTDFQVQNLTGAFLSQKYSMKSAF